MRLISLSVIAAFALSGCAVNSFLFEAHENRPIVAIDYPPNRLAYGGHLNEEDVETLTKVIGAMSRSAYRPHHYKYPMGISTDLSNKDDNTNSFKGSSTLTVKRKRR